MNVQSISPNVNFTGKILESDAKKEIFDYVEKNNYRADEFNAAVKNFTDKEPKKDTIEFLKTDDGNFKLIRKSKSGGRCTFTSDLKNTIDTMCTFFRPKEVIFGDDYTFEEL